MRVTIAVCTRNRATSLARTLDGMQGLRVPNGLEWEILVVDNGSTDGTAGVIAAVTNRLPVRGVPEERAGLSNARNRAVAVAAGQYIVWTDDDVLVDEGWLAAYTEAFARWPNAVVFGGPILPDFAGTPPVWLQRTLSRVGGAYALVDLGPEPVPLRIAGFQLPFGANYAVRADEQRRRPYDPVFGRRPGHPGMVGEETALFEAILEAGGEGRWVPGARVRHVIPKERQTVRYLRRQIAGYEEFRARQRATRGDATAGERPASLLRACLAEARLAVRRAIAPPEKWIEDLAIAGAQWGWLRARGQGKQEHP